MRTERSRRVPIPCTISGSPTMSPTVIRGSSDEYGILEDDLHLAPHPAEILAAELGQLRPLELDGAGRGLQQLQDAVAGRRLAGARLADESERLARLRRRS